MNRLSLRNNRLKFKTTVGKLPTILEEIIGCTPILQGKPRGCRHGTGWTCKHEEFNCLCPKTSPDRCQCLEFTITAYLSRSFLLTLALKTMDMYYDTIGYGMIELES